MTGNFKAHIFVVDDDPCILEVICLALKKAKFGCTCFAFANADDCIRQLRTQGCDLLVTDVRMPGKDGIELLNEARSIAPWLPVIVMTAYGDIPLAVGAIKAGAANFIEKPFEWQSFLATVESALKQNEPADLLKGKPLSKVETTVLRLILQGKSNKEVAHTLGRSVRTIEVHRSHIMHKLNVDNVVDL